MASPAITASTPDSNIASQIPTPDQHRGRARASEPAQRSAISTPNSADGDRERRHETSSV